MAYIKTIWKARKGSGLNRFRKIQETTSSVILNNEPNLIDEPGTPFSVKLMNNIEEGIEKAHFLIVEESVERKETDQSLQQAILNEVENRTIAVSEEARNRTAAIKEHDEKTTAHPDIRNILNRLTGLPEWDSDNHILTFTAEDGSTLEVDIPLENLIKEIDFDPATNEIILFKHDGTEIRINVGDLVDVYTGSIGTHIQIKIDDENEIQAILRAGSITRSELAAALLTELDDKANKNEVIPLNQKGAAGGVATLDNNGTIPANQLPEGGGLFTVARDETLRGDGTSGNPLGVNLPIGVTYRQGAGDYDPYEAGLPGEWALWNER
ncbi:MAG: hypothetical protein FWC21_06550, partial [Treponema sp.]|nr:hypothetical protein [Treponema sp.]